MSSPRYAPRPSSAALIGLIVTMALLAAVLARVAPAHAASTYSLAVSTHSDRASSKRLAGATFDSTAKIYVFSTPSTLVKRVHFYLDDPRRAGTPRTVEPGAPFDFNGTAAHGNAVAFNVAGVSVGSHTITAAIARNGKTTVVSATFTVTTPKTPARSRRRARGRGRGVTAAMSRKTSPPAPDTTPPTSPSLSAAPGDQQVTLTWTASTDAVGVTRYEVWKDNGYVAGLGATARSYAVTGLSAGVSSSFRVVAYDAAGNYANSNTVSAAALATILTTPPPSSATPAPFPSRLKASGRAITDENGYVLPTLRGFNMHVVPWDQSHFDAIAAQGGKINRAVLHWDDFEPTQGVISATSLASLDLHIARAQAAGIYTLLELHLNVGRVPSWTSAKATELEKYAAYGQTLTQALAYRYGNPASSHYTKAVIGFGLNEPPLEDDTIRNGNSSIPYLEGKQRQMISWMRASGYAPSWIGFVAYGYASATPIYDPTYQNAAAANASPTAYDSVGGNVVIDVHDYVVGCSNTDPNCDGRQWNGMSYPDYQGGPQLGPSSDYTSSALRRSQQVAFLKPYKTFSTQANIPLMLGEWGWPQGPAGETAWITDKMAAWADAGTVIEMQWNYDISSTNSEWAARPGGTWRPSTAAWLVPPA